MKRYLPFLVLILLFIPAKVFADDCDQQCQLRKQIAEYQDKITQLQGQANTLSNQIASFNAQINLGELKIEQTEDQIKLLGGRIDQVQTSLTDLNKAFSARAVATYEMARVEAPIYFLLSGSINQAVSKFHYLQDIESADQNLLHRLQSAQVTYQNSKKQSEDLHKQLQTQQDSLNAQKFAKAKLLADTKGSEQNYQRLLAQAQAQLAAFRNFVSGQGGASILSGQTFCNDWGCYYNQRDQEWGNQAMGSSNLSVAEFGCLVSSSAMIAKHYGRNINPGDIAGSVSAFFSPDSGTALLWRDITVNGTRIIRNSVGANTANIDSELAAGRPVIIGLYNGPAHFIVLKSGSNGNYMMNDPFMPNGHDVNFGSKYSTNDITDVEYVSVQ
jgi:peptidoglycan hydrolase CwlO-like protein